MAASAIPKTMRGILIEKTGGVEVLQYLKDLPVPQPKAGECLVKNDLAGINYIDTYFRTGLYPSKKPEILGREAVGTLLSVPEATKDQPTYALKKGQRVVWMHTGGYAEYTAVPVKNIQPVPDKVTDEQAVGGLLQGLTALTMIREAYPVKKGDWILVHAAAGGVGLLLVQMLKAIGANIIATASTEEKLQTAQAAGATHTLLSGTPHDELVAKILELTREKDAEAGEKPEEGCHAVLDGVGKATFELDLAVIRRKGTLISFGNASGAVDPVPLTKLTAKNIRLMRTTLFNYLTTRHENTTYTDELFQMIADGKLDIKIHKVYPLEDVKQAHQDLEGRKTMGKLLLKI